MFFAVGDHEMLLDDTLTVVSRLKAERVPVVCERKRGMFHTYVLYKNYMPESRETSDGFLTFWCHSCSASPALYCSPHAHSESRPVTRVIDVMLADDHTLYFPTAKGRRSTNS